PRRDDRGLAARQPVPEVLATPAVRGNGPDPADGRRGPTPTDALAPVRAACSHVASLHDGPNHAGPARFLTPRGDCTNWPVPCARLEASLPREIWPLRRRMAAKRTKSGSPAPEPGPRRDASLGRARPNS